MAIWKAFYVTCGECGHRNRPDKSPAEGIRLALQGAIACKKCGNEMDVREKLRRSARPLVRRVLQGLAREDAFL